MIKVITLSFFVFTGPDLTDEYTFSYTSDAACIETGMRMSQIWEKLPRVSVSWDCLTVSWEPVI